MKLLELKKILFTKQKNGTYFDVPFLNSNFIFYLNFNDSPLGLIYKLKF